MGEEPIVYGSGQTDINPMKTARNTLGALVGVGQDKLKKATKEADKRIAKEEKQLLKKKKRKKISNPFGGRHLFRM